MYVCEVWMRLLYMSVQALYGEANALYWKSSQRQNSTHLTPLKPQNTKTALCKLPKNHWVIALDCFGCVRKKLLVTVSLDHSVFFLAMFLPQISFRVLAGSPCANSTSLVRNNLINKNKF